jgi:hypothetical protein
MPDVWTTVSELDPGMQERLAGVLETRGADPQQQEMRRLFLAEIPFPARGRVLEVGCGTGVLTRALARLPGIDAVLGGRPICPTSSSGTLTVDRFHWADEAFDVVIFDSTLRSLALPVHDVVETEAPSTRTSKPPRSRTSRRFMVRLL